MTKEALLTPAQRHRRVMQVIGFAAGPAVAALVLFAPSPALSRDAQVLAAILAWVVLYWVAEPIPSPVTALLGAVVCVVAGLGSLRSVFAPYTHPIMALLIGSLLLAEAMTVQGVAGRFASAMLSLSWVEARPMRMLLMVGTVTAGVSMWISNTAATALMLPIARSLVGSFHRRAEVMHGDYRTGLMLMLSFAATAGGIATVIGTPTNLVGVGLIAEHGETTISFATWMALGGPLALVLLIVAWGLVWWLHPAESPTGSHGVGLPEGQRQALGPWTRGQVNTCTVFGVAVLLWVLPGLVTALWGSNNPVAGWFRTVLPNERVALLAAGVLFILPIDWRRGEWTLSWRHVVHVRWDVLLLFGSGLAFGELMVKTGLADFIGRGFVSLLGSHTVWSLTAMSILVAVLISELVSNTATATMAVPLAIAIASVAGVSPVPPALGATLGASLGFALPVSTPPNAIVYGTGLVPLTSMIRAGLLFDLLGAVMIWITLRLLCPLLGLA